MSPLAAALITALVVFPAAFLVGGAWVASQVREKSNEAFDAMHAQVDAMEAVADKVGRWAPPPEVLEAWRTSMPVSLRGAPMAEVWSEEATRRLLAEVSRPLKCESCLDHIATHLVTWPDLDGDEAVEPFAICSLCVKLVGGGAGRSPGIQVVEL